MCFFAYLAIFTTVKKKGAETKREKMEKVRDMIDSYNYVFVFDVSNFRNQTMKELKIEFKETSCFYMGKIALSMVALGKDIKSEYRNNLHCLTKCLNSNAKGAHKGLLFTNLKPDFILQYFENFKQITFPKTGFVATHDFIVKQGILQYIIQCL